MSNALLAAFAQPTLDLQAPVARRRRPSARVLSPRVLPSAAPAGRSWDAVPAVEPPANEELSLGQAVAAAFDHIEALEVGRAVVPRAGFRAGDVVLVDWTGGTSGNVRARRGSGGVVLEADSQEGSGVVFAVIRRLAGH